MSFQLSLLVLQNICYQVTFKAQILFQYSYDINLFRRWFIKARLEAYQAIYLIYKKTLREFLVYFKNFLKNSIIAFFLSKETRCCQCKNFFVFNDFFVLETK